MGRVTGGAVGEEGDCGQASGYVEGVEGVGLAWNLKAARFHRKPSCDMLPSGWTQAQRGGRQQDPDHEGYHDGWLQGWRMEGPGLGSAATDAAAAAGLCVRARVVAALSS